MFAAFIACTRSELTCSYEKTVEHYGCRLMKQSLVSESDMEVISGTHWSSTSGTYDDQNVTALWSSNSVVKIFPSLFPLKFLQLKYIYLSNSTFETLNAPFDNCGNLQSIVISQNTISQVPSGVFTKCANLRVLSLAANEITHIDDEAFNDLTKLKSLFLQSNKITDLGKDVFKSLTNLEYIDLNDNVLKNLATEVFWPLTALVALEIKNNKISEIDENLFNYNIKLSEINLEGNSLDFVGENAEKVFKNLQNLRILQLQNNLIRKLPTFEGIDSLEKLDVSSNMMLVVTPYAFALPNLKHLNMNDNQISVDEDFLRFSKSLETLQLSKNGVRTIEDRVFLHLNKLQSLDLSSNLLTDLKAVCFKGLDSLRKLDLSFNKIEKIDKEMFENLPRLFELDMRNNKCVNVEMTFGESVKDVIDKNLLECVNTATGSKASFVTISFVLLISFFDIL